MLLIFWIGLLVSIILSNIPFNPISPKGRYKNFFHTLFPQGWSFFTRNPKENRLIIFRLKSNYKLKEIDIRNSAPNNYYGISRLNRIKGIELSMIDSQVGPNSWVQCDTEKDQKNAIDTLMPQIVINRTCINSLCGLYILKKESPIPWAWHKNANRLEMPAKIAKVYVVCNK